VMVFFSVCMETYNRGKTIYDAILSVKNQTFKDYEVIIVDNASTDNTVSEINRALKYCEDKALFLHTSMFNYVFIRNTEHLSGQRNWNEPLKHATGEYIVILEGDDMFKSGHLKRAYSVIKHGLDTHDVILGFYATGNQINKKEISGIFDSKEIFDLLYTIHNLSPPSETIFINKYRFNVDDFIYYPEVDLLLRIASDGYCAYYDDNQNVIRGMSTSDRRRYRWVYYTDAYTLLEKYRGQAGERLYRKTLLKVIYRDVKLKVQEFLRELIR